MLGMCVLGSDRTEVSVVGRVQSNRIKLLLFILDLSQRLKSQKKMERVHTLTLKHTHVLYGDTGVCVVLQAMSQRRQRWTK